jgi:hypothetical protein
MLVLIGATPEGKKELVGFQTERSPFADRFTLKANSRYSYGELESRTASNVKKCWNLRRGAHAKRHRRLGSGMRGRGKQRTWVVTMRRWRSVLSDMDRPLAWENLRMAASVYRNELCD